MVVVNGCKLFNVKKPFRFYINRKKVPYAVKSLDYLSRKPSDTFKSEYLLRYSVTINEDYVGRLFTHYSRGLKCHSIYGVEKAGDFSATGHALFRSKAVEFIVENLYSNKEPFKHIRFYLQKVVEKVQKSYGFSCCFTDSPVLFDLLKEVDVNVLLSSWSMISVPDGLDGKLRDIFLLLLEIMILDLLRLIPKFLSRGWLSEKMRFE